MMTAYPDTSEELAVEPLNGGCSNAPSQELGAVDEHPDVPLHQQQPPTHLVQSHTVTATRSPKYTVTRSHNHTITTTADADSKKCCCRGNILPYYLGAHHLDLRPHCQQHTPPRLYHQSGPLHACVPNVLQPATRSGLDHNPVNRDNDNTSTRDDINAKMTSEYHARI